MSPYNLLVAAMLGARANICGSKGYDAGTESYYYDDSGSQGSLSACGAVCLKDSQCKSFAFSSTECLLYKVAVTGNFDADSGSPYSFYDRACVAAASSTSTSSTKLSTSTSAAKTSSTSVIVTSSTKASSSSTSSSTSSSAAPSTSSSSSSTHSTTSSSSSSSTPVTSSTHSTTSSTSSSSSSSSKASATSATSTSATSTSASSSSKASSTSVSAPATATPSSTVAIPSGCNIPAYVTVTAFSWFNSSTNLDCVVGTSQTGCYNGQWCTPTGANDTSCTNCGVNYCEGGLPTPPGYGPPDDIQISYTDPVNGGRGCEEQNPQFTRRYEVGDGQVTCGSAFPYLSFFGNSNVPSSQGNVQTNTPSVTCADGTQHSPSYSGYIPIACTYDSGNNATCTSPGLPALIPLSSLN